MVLPSKGSMSRTSITPRGASAKVRTSKNRARNYTDFYNSSEDARPKLTPGGFNLNISMGGGSKSVSHRLDKTEEDEQDPKLAAVRRRLAKFSKKAQRKKK